MESFMAMEPSDHEDRVNEQIGESGKVKCLKTSDQFYLDTPEKLQTRFTLHHQFEVLTRDALSLLIHGVMRWAWGINWAAQLLRFLIGCRLYEFNRWLKDAELQSHSHLWEKQVRDKDLCHVRSSPDALHENHMYKPICGRHIIGAAFSRSIQAICTWLVWY